MASPTPKTLPPATTIAVTTPINTTADSKGGINTTVTTTAGVNQLPNPLTELGEAGGGPLMTELLESEKSEDPLKEKTILQITPLPQSQSKGDLEINEAGQHSQSEDSDSDDSDSEDISHQGKEPNPNLFIKTDYSSPTSGSKDDESLSTGNMHAASPKSALFDNGSPSDKGSPSVFKDALGNDIHIAESDLPASSLPTPRSAPMKHPYIKGAAVIMAILLSVNLLVFGCFGVFKLVGMNPLGLSNTITYVALGLGGAGLLVVTPATVVGIIKLVKASKRANTPQVQ